MPEELQASALGDVEHTALLTIFCHAIESRSPAPILRDPLAEELAGRLTPALAASPNPLARRLARGELRAPMVVYITLRARQFDAYARDFAARHPGAAVVNLGCGLDTRFSRIDDGALRVVDVDLPTMIGLKRQLIAEEERYQMIASSVLDHGWMDAIEGPAIFLAEGLFMYLPEDGVRALVLALARRFPGSELVFETFNARWLTGWRGRVTRRKLQDKLKLGAGATFQFGIEDGAALEAWDPRLRYLGEWIFLDEDEPKLGALRLFRRWDWFRHTQWTVRYALG
ncbi:MAG: class I SAM-dependent methyltransferase [Myxococcales bacterium]|nr:class I SAM-dependent methyltransferase [Myxococcales bacterium]